MRINLSLPGRATFPMEVAPHETVADIVVRVASMVGGTLHHHHHHQHTLLYNGTALNPERSLSSYNVAAGATLTVAVHHPSMQVFIKTLTGRTIVLNVEHDDTVGTVKRKIQEQERIPAEMQRLIFVGELLDDRVRFLDYRVEYESAVHLAISAGDSFQLSVSLPRGGSALLEVLPSDTVASVKWNIQDKEGVPFDVQQLSFEGRRLSDADTIAGSGIAPNNSVVLLTTDESRDTQIFVSIPGRERISLWVNREYTIARVKELIESREGVPADTQRLYFARRALADGQTLATCGIETNHMLHLELEDPPLVNLRLRKQSGTAFELSAPSNELVGELKVRVAAIEGTRVEDVLLYFNGAEVPDSTKLCHVPLADGSTVDLITPPGLSFGDGRCGQGGGEGRGGLLIFVRSLAGKVVPIQLLSTDTVGELKRRIEDLEGIPLTNQCLVCGGCQLEDSRTIGDCHLQNQSTVHLVVRVPRLLHLQVCTLDGNSVQYSANPAGTVRSLLEGMGTSDVEEVRVFVENQELLPERLLGSYHVRDGSIVRLQAKDT